MGLCHMAWIACCTGWPYRNEAGSERCDMDIIGIGETE